MRTSGSPSSARRRKALGQHFLVRTATVSRILDLLEISPGDRFLEIGPGLGALTLAIADRGAVVHAVEIDPGLIDRLRPVLASRQTARLIPGDILSLDPGDLLDGLRTGSPRAKVRVVGNLPYRIATAVLQKYLENPGGIRDYHFMFQKEVADRLVAQPGSSDYGYISVLTQIHCRSRILLQLPPGAFRPPPRVQSALVSLIPRTPRWRSPRLEAGFRHLLRLAFASRRKTLGNNLRRATGWDRSEARKFLERSGLPAEVRPQELSPEAFATLFRRLHRAGVLS